MSAVCAILKRGGTVADFLPKAGDIAATGRPNLDHAVAGVVVHTTSTVARKSGIAVSMSGANGAGGAVTESGAATFARRS